MKSAATGITPELVAEHGLSRDEFERIVAILGREPNLVELGVLSVMWSEHCSYKSSKIHLAKLPTQAPWVVQGPGENAGVVDIGDGEVAIFKMESHNHPSFIEPFQGATTGVGGILRDIFTMGARPVALLDALRFGDPDHPRTRHLVAGVVAGVGAYGNCVGVPTVGGECTFHPSFDGNILVNAMCVGVARKDKVFLAKAGGIGNPVLYVGAKTGRDGIHGASMASAEFSADSEARRPTVQVGDPFTEKLLIEACLELMAGSCIVAIQDMGAAGLTSSSFEMAARGGCGIDLDLDAVPLREAGMSPYEIMLSESQERMLMVLHAGREAEAAAVFDKWGLDCAVVGSVTGSGRLVLRHLGAVVADLPVAAVDASSPLYERPSERQPPADPITVFDEDRPCPDRAALLTLLGSPDLASKRWIFEQYDHLVRGDTAQRPGGDAAVVRVGAEGKALALTTDCTPRYCAADPFTGAKQAVAETWRNLVAVGAKPLADHQLPQLRQPGAAARHGPARGRDRGHGGGLPGARLPRRLGQRLALQRDRRPPDPAGAGDRRAGAHPRSTADVHAPPGQVRLAPHPGRDRRGLARRLDLSPRRHGTGGRRPAAGRPRRRTPARRVRGYADRGRVRGGLP